MSAADSSESWLTSPLDIVRDLLEKHGNGYLAYVNSFFTERLAEGTDTVARIPSLNDYKPHELKPNSLARFRCMVQDMYGPEFYLDTYDGTVRHEQVTETRRCSGRYRDVVTNHDFANEQPDTYESNSESTAITLERQVYYCVPVPGENGWVKKVLQSGSDDQIPSTSFTSLRNKRSLDEEEGSSNHDVMDTDDSACAKKQRVTCSSKNDTLQTAKVFNSNFPLPGEQGQPCLVKIYDESIPIRLNDVIEVVGVLSVDPALTAIIAEEATESPFAEEFQARNPPPSLVPRLHVVALHKPATLYPRMMSSAGAQDDLLECRGELLAILERALLGDRLAAEYALCSLVASIYARRDHLAIGKFCVNLSGCPTKDSGAFVSSFYQLLQQLRPASHTLELTVSSTNSLTFVPKKDYVTDRLTSGILQLAAGTLLVVDETHLEPGQLDQNGTKNLGALNSLITWQRVAYDFGYHSQEFECDVSVITLSEGKSILQHDCQIVLQWQSVASVAASYDAIWTYLTPKLVERLRCYLSAVLRSVYDVPSAMQNHVQEDFVSSRQQNAKAMTVEDFQLLITLARLISISCGMTELTEATWNKVRLMEEERKSRFSAL